MLYEWLDGHYPRVGLGGAGINVAVGRKTLRKGEHEHGTY